MAASILKVKTLSMRLKNTSMQRRCMGMHRCKAQPLSRGNPPDAEGLMDAAAPEAVQPGASNTHQAKAGVHVAIKRHGLLLLQAESSLKLTLQRERMQPQFSPSAKAIIKLTPCQHALLQPACRHAAAALAACRCRQGGNLLAGASHATHHMVVTRCQDVSSWHLLLTTASRKALTASGVALRFLSARCCSSSASAITELLKASSI